MGRFEPSGDPRDAVQRGFYVPRPGRSMAEQLAARFELKPSAAHLLVGGVGSGKTTQLLVARDKLDATGDVCAIYADVSARSDLEWMNSAGVLATVGLELEPHVQATEELAKTFRVFEDYLGSSNDPRWRRNIVDLFVRDLKEMFALVDSRHRDIVVLLDALDRISDLDDFSGIVDGAIAELRSLGIGVVLVGPLISLYGLQRVTLERFDRVWHLPAVDVQHDAEGQRFLVQVLKARDENNLLTEEALERVAWFSGGVMRDLIALAQAAGEEAYVHGAERVETEHVNIAADLFGRKHLVALDSQQLAVL